MKFFRVWLSDWRAYTAEFTATFFFVFIASFATLSELYFGDLGRIGTSLAIGFSYAGLLFATVGHAGGFLNPVITLALWLSQKLSGLKAVSFIFFQVLASFLAFGLLLYIFGQTSLDANLGGPVLAEGADLQKAAIVEALGAGILVFSVFATFVDRSGPVSFGPLAVGLVLTSLTLVAQGISGAVFNPLRALAPAVISQNFGNLALYLIGPTAGSLFGLFYEFVFLKKGKK